MKVIVDTNILFSGILNPVGTISDLLMYSDDTFTFYAPHFILEELNTHRLKILRLSGLSDKEFELLLRTILKKIELINPESLPAESWEKAAELTSEVDEFDIPFVALGIALNAPLWTGDKKLIKGLKAKGVHWILSTAEIEEIRSEG